jgi:hypothetical protein
VALPRLTRNCARAQVWKAKCKPLEDEIVAIKILDLERQDPGKLVRPPSIVLWELYLQSPTNPLRWPRPPRGAGTTRVSLSQLGC